MQQQSVLTACAFVCLIACCYGQTFSQNLETFIQRIWATPPPPADYEPDLSAKIPASVSFLLLFFFNAFAIFILKKLRECPIVFWLLAIGLFGVLAHSFWCWVNYLYDLANGFIQPLGVGYHADSYCGHASDAIANGTKVPVDIVAEFFPNISAALLSSDAWSVFLVSGIFIYFQNKKYNIPFGNGLALFSWTGITFPIYILLMICVESKQEAIDKNQPQAQRQRKADNKFLWSVLQLLCLITWLPLALHYWNAYHAFQFNVLGGGVRLTGSSTWGSKLIIYTWVFFLAWFVEHIWYESSWKQFFLATLLANYCGIHVGASICAYMLFRHYLVQPGRLN